MQSTTYLSTQRDILTLWLSVRKGVHTAKRITATIPRSSLTRTGLTPSNSRKLGQSVSVCMCACVHSKQMTDK